MKKAKAIIATAFMLFVSVCASGQDVGRQRSEMEKLKKEMADIEELLKANRKSQKTNMTELSLLNRKVDACGKIIEKLGSEIRTIDRKIAEKNEEIAKATEKLDTMKVRYTKLVREAYKIRDSRIWFLHIIASRNITEGYRRTKYLSSLSSSLRNRTEEIRQQQLALEHKRAELQNLRKDAETRKAEQEDERSKLSSAKAETEKVIRNLASREKEMKKDIGRKRKETERLAKEIERIIQETLRKEEEARRKAAEATDKNKKKEEPARIDIKLSGEFSANKGRLPWPVANGTVTEKFGQHNHPVFKHIKLPYNNGINISAPEGSKVKCVFSGVVKQILIVPGYNQCILVQHGEYFTFYCKLKSVDVRTGQMLETGQTIGTADTEDGNGVLHFELWKGTVKQNPEIWLR